MVPILLLVIGFGLIFAGWNGAAGIDYTQGQIPFLISGGITGLALVVFGATGLLLRSIRQGQDRQLDELKQMSQYMQRAGSSTASSNGSNGHSDGDLVLVGASSFHQASCRLVKGRSPVKVPRGQAEEEGLQPCRICNP